MLEFDNLAALLTAVLLHPAVTGIAGFISGALVGYKLDVRKARRVEWNQIAEPIRNELRAQLQLPIPKPVIIPLGGWDGLEQRLNPRQRERLQRVCSTYTQTVTALQRADDVGQPYYHDLPTIRAQMSALLSVLPVR